MPKLKLDLTPLDFSMWNDMQQMIVKNSNIIVAQIVAAQCLRTTDGYTDRMHPPLPPPPLPTPPVQYGGASRSSGPVWSAMISDPTMLEVTSDFEGDVDIEEDVN